MEEKKLQSRKLWMAIGAVVTQLAVMVPRVLAENSGMDALILVIGVVVTVSVYELSQRGVDIMKWALEIAKITGKAPSNIPN